MAVVVGMSLGLAGQRCRPSSITRWRVVYPRSVSNAASFECGAGDSPGIGIPAYRISGLFPRTPLFCAVSALMLTTASPAGPRVATSGVVLFGIAMVFTFNALVSMMQFIATGRTPYRGWFSGRWAAGARHRVKLGVMTLAFAVLLPISAGNSWKLTALRLGERIALSVLVLTCAVCVSVRCFLRIGILTAGGGFVGPIAFIGPAAPHCPHDVR